ncbi:MULTISPECIES: TetR/AcrR family transcriptional regulator [Sutcliffiella]|uniref:TetR family transcriptional regulator n=1 Tax=Sutcliffiella cohnii TaxID=33932 RepID=A0A223KWD7_9BACI|nr:MULTISPECIES: TetR/AcrR family transcriptional regulator [Sutcliffiella]AST93785.1 TetR family transcriptional regulator [Sutcliffiella cohnii]MED4015885.1 TetR/AcrR family transcriptional regulator [Sutcliffiella cohnii]WBL14976.1 TetR/AcrR family transcriptional regulator [Sutcliffiella sp. NC1]
MKKRQVHASVKDEKLIEKRRDQMIKGAVSLFKEKGFHRTTTRELAKEAGFSIGTLYEYIRTKEDVLYLVCDRIYDQVGERLQQELDMNRGCLKSLKSAIYYYFHVMDEMQDEVLVMYQEAKSLSKDALPYVLNKELQMVGMFERVIRNCVEYENLPVSEKEISLLAHNLFVQGQMWGFRRWALQKQFNLNEYIELQLEILLHGLMKGEKK